MRWVLIVAALLIPISAWGASHGNPWVNAASSIGANLSSPISSGSGVMPFVNVFKTGGDWWAGFSPGFGTHTNEEAYLYANCLDANLYASTTACPNSTFTGSASGSTTMVVSALGSGPGPWLGGTLNVTGSPTVTACPAAGCGITGSYTLSASSTFSGSVTESLTAALLWVTLNYAMPAPYYQGGSWTINFSGVGPVSITGDGSVTCSSPPCTFTVTPSSSGMTVIAPIPGPDAATNIQLYLTANASLVTTGDCTAAIALGKSCFDPVFIAKLQNFSTVRFMQAFDTYTNQSVNWADRALTNYAFWNVGDNNGTLSPKGWPYEVAAALCNQLNADCWPNEPCISTEAYAASMAALFASLLKPNLKVYVEYCNEIMFRAQSAPIPATMASRGYVIFPTAGNDNNATYMYGLQRAIDDGAAWKTAFGTNSNNVVRLLGGQAGCDGCYQQNLLGYSSPIFGGGSWTGIAATHFDALATAPYWTASVPSADTADPDGGLTAFFCINGAIGSPCHGQVPSGASAVTTGGTSTAYTLADGTGSGCPAAVTVNGYVTTAVFHTTNGASPTLAVDGCAAQPILCDGGPIEVQTANVVVCNNSGNVGTVPPTASFATGSSNPYLLAYTTTTANGTVTPSWRIVCVGVSCIGTTIQQAVGYITNNIADVATYNMQPGVSMTNVLYEGGVQTISGTQNGTDVWYNLFNSAATDVRNYQAIGLLMSGLRATGLNGVFVYYHSIGHGGFLGQNYGLWDTQYQTANPPKAQGALDFIRRNPCWWTINGQPCRH